MPCIKTISVCKLLSATTPFVEFSRNSVYEFITGFANKNEFCENCITGIHTLLQGTNEHASVISIFIYQFGQNSAQVSTLCRLANMRITKTGSGKDTFC